MNEGIYEIVRRLERVLLSDNVQLHNSLSQYGVFLIPNGISCQRPFFVTFPDFLVVLKASLSISGLPLFLKSTFRFFALLDVAVV